MADNKKNLFVRHEVPDQDKHIQEKKKKGAEHTFTKKNHLRN